MSAGVRAPLPYLRSRKVRRSHRAAGQARAAAITAANAADISGNGMPERNPPARTTRATAAPISSAARGTAASITGSSTGRNSLVVASRSTNAAIAQIPRVVTTARVCDEASKDTAVTAAIRTHDHSRNQASRRRDIRSAGRPIAHPSATSVTRTSRTALRSPTRSSGSHAHWPSASRSAASTSAAGTMARTTIVRPIRLPGSRSSSTAAASPSAGQPAQNRAPVGRSWPKPAKTGSSPIVVAPAAAKTTRGTPERTGARAVIAP